MNRSTFCKIKYMNRLLLFFFQRPGILLGLVSEYPHTHTHTLSVYVNCVQLNSLLQVCPNYAQWMMRYHLDLLYSDDAQFLGHLWI